MADLNITPELKEELLKAQSAQEARDLLTAAGQELAAEAAERIWQEIERHRVDYSKELSDNELEAVAGGLEFRSYEKQGCAATVDKTSWCWSSDACVCFDVQYYDFNV